MREWCSAQAASGYIAFDPDAETFTLPPEEAMAFADDSSPVFILRGYHVVSAADKDRAGITERIRAGAGFDLVCFFDCLHDMGDPVGALKHIRETLDDDGT